MKLFLDASVLLAACGSDTGASAEVFRRAGASGWRLIATPYVKAEVANNLIHLPAGRERRWPVLERSVVIYPNVLTLDRPSIFGPAKDRPVLYSALAWADVLLTLDRSDFGELYGQTFYGLVVLRPGQFLQQQRGRGG